MIRKAITPVATAIPVDGNSSIAIADARTLARMLTRLFDIKIVEIISFGWSFQKIKSRPALPPRRMILLIRSRSRDKSAVSDAERKPESPIMTMIVIILPVITVPVLFLSLLYGGLEYRRATPAYEEFRA